MSKGAFVISLDFELHWGIFDKKSVHGPYKKHLEGTRGAIDALLELFAGYDINATWATVGFLFAGNRKERLRFDPVVLPGYEDESLNPYLTPYGENDADDPFHFAWPVIEKISRQKGQEIATHTYSHYYCLEKGASVDSFEADIKSACEIASEKGITLKSLVFPRNQVRKEFLPILRKYGIIAYRGNPDHPFYREKPGEEDGRLLRRAGRLADAYLPISGDLTHQPDYSVSPVNIPGSMFLRPYRKKLAAIDGLRARRITSQMSVAAKTGRVFHLWWHPHNFGAEPKENLRFLKKLLEHYVGLREKYGMESLNMAESGEGFYIE